MRPNAPLPVAIFATFAAIAGIPACGGTTKDAQGPAKAVAAKVERIPGEGDLTRIVLSAAAEQRLGIATAPVQRRAVERVRWLGAQTMVVPGSAATIAAPIAGRLATVTELAAGAPVSAGQPLFTLAPILAPESRANLTVALAAAAGEIERTRVVEAAARVAQDRAAGLLADKVGSPRAAEEADAAVAVASAAHTATAQQHRALAAALADIDAGAPTTLAIVAPRAGTIVDLRAVAGQLVPAGAPLLEIQSLDTLWLRVPVPADLAASVRTDRDVRFGAVALRDLAAATTATPVAGPPAVDPVTAAIVMFYAFDNRAGLRRPGERCAVAMPLADQDERLVLPRSAVLHDAHGGTWVYRQQAPQDYRRQRVDVAWATGELAVLERGPEAGTVVVTAGAAELFGTEFGVGK